MNKCVYGISARIECLGGDIVVRTNPETKILLGRRFKIGWWLMMLGMRIIAGEDKIYEEVLTMDLNKFTEDFRSAIAMFSPTDKNGEYLKDISSEAMEIIRPSTAHFRKAHYGSWYIPFCGHCNNYLANETWRACPVCGKLIDWSEKENFYDA